MSLRNADTSMLIHKRLGSPAVLSPDQQQVSRTENYEQLNMIPQMKLLFKIPKEELVAGYCHGLCINWGLRMAQCKEKKHYRMREVLVKMKDETWLRETISNEGLAKDIAQVEFIQFAEKYCKSSIAVNDDPTFHHQQCVDVLMREAQKIVWCDHQNQVATFNNNETTERVQISTQVMKIADYNMDDLKSLIKKMDKSRNNMLVLTSYDKLSHSIAIFYRDECYYVYNSNYIFATAKCFEDIRTARLPKGETVWDEVVRCLFQDFDINVGEKFSLRTNLLTVTKVPMMQCTETAIAAVMPPSPASVVKFYVAPNAPGRHITPQPRRKTAITLKRAKNLFQDKPIEAAATDQLAKQENKVESVEHTGAKRSRGC